MVTYRELRKIRRGEIYYIEKQRLYADTGSEQGAGRPAIIVSNNYANTSSGVYEVVFLTTKEKTELPTHVLIDNSRISLKEPSTALCEQVMSVSVKRIGNYVGTVDDETMEKIDRALLISLDLERYAVESDEENESEQTTAEDRAECYAEARAEYDKESGHTAFSARLALIEKEKALEKCKSMEVELAMAKNMMQFYKSQYESMVNGIMSKL